MEGRTPSVLAAEVGVPVAEGVEGPDRLQAITVNLHEPTPRVDRRQVELDISSRLADGTLAKRSQRIHVDLLVL